MRLLRILYIPLLVIALILTSAENSVGQTYQWYLIKSAAPIHIEESKAVITAIKQFAPDAEIWFNGEKSSTFGVKNLQQLNWISILTVLNNDGYYLANVSKGDLHYTGSEARTSIFYQEARYYALNPKSMPGTFAARLNEHEWQALVPAVRNYYQSTGKYSIIEL